MRRVATAVALALTVLGCGPVPADQVTLAIAENARPSGCYLTPFYTYELIADPIYGTAIRSESGETAPLYWPPGYTGHRVGSEVEVWDPDGRVVATTGGRYTIGPGEPYSEGSGLVVGCITPA